METILENKTFEKKSRVPSDQHMKTILDKWKDWLTNQVKEKCKPVHNLSTREEKMKYYS